MSITDTVTRYVCPACRTHTVRVRTAGFAATTAEVAGCPLFGGYVLEVPASSLHDLIPATDRVRAAGGYDGYPSGPLAGPCD